MPSAKKKKKEGGHDPPPPTPLRGLTTEQVSHSTTLLWPFAVRGDGERLVVGVDRLVALL